MNAMKDFHLNPLNEVERKREAGKSSILSDCFVGFNADKSRLIKRDGTTPVDPAFLKPSL